MASSTTNPMESTMASRVRTLMEKPITYMMKNDPMRDMGMAMMGIKVVRQLRRKAKMMSTTRTNAIMMVSSTSFSDLRI